VEFNCTQHLIWQRLPISLKLHKGYYVQFNLALLAELSTVLQTLQLEQSQKNLVTFLTVDRISNILYSTNEHFHIQIDLINVYFQSSSNYSRVLNI